ncbi:unnamed protein product [Arctogadus glacialis]
MEFQMVTDFRSIIIQRCDREITPFSQVQSLSPAATATAPDTPPPLQQQVTGLLGERDGKKMIGLKHKVKV